VVSNLIPSMAKVGQYFLFDTLGRGGLGKVKLGIDENSGEHVAIKLMDKSVLESVGISSDFKKEQLLMKSLQNDNIVPIKDVISNQSTIYLVMDLLTGGEIISKVAIEGAYGEDIAREYFKQILNALDYCLKRGISHRNLKSENILLDDRDSRLKITDFGLYPKSITKILDAEGLKTSQASQQSALPFRAPEFFDSKLDLHSGEKIDMWASGIILYVMLAGFFPFYHSDVNVLSKMIVNDPPNFPESFPTDARDLVERLLKKNPAERAGIRQVLNDPWVNGKAVARPTIPKAVSSAASSSVETKSGPRIVRRKIVRHVRKGEDGQMVVLKEQITEEQVEKSTLPDSERLSMVSKQRNSTNSAVEEKESAPNTRGLRAFSKFSSTDSETKRMQRRVASIRVVPNDSKSGGGIFGIFKPLGGTNAQGVVQVSTLTNNVGLAANRSEALDVIDDMDDTEVYEDPEEDLDIVAPVVQTKTSIVIGKIPEKEPLVVDLSTVDTTDMFADVDEDEQPETDIVQETAHESGSSLAELSGENAATALQSTMLDRAASSNDSHAELDENIELDMDKKDGLVESKSEKSVETRMYETASESVSRNESEKSESETIEDREAHGDLSGALPDPPDQRLSAAALKSLPETGTSFGSMKSDHFVDAFGRESSTLAALDSIADGIPGVSGPLASLRSQVDESTVERQHSAPNEELKLSRELSEKIARTKSVTFKLGDTAGASSSSVDGSCGKESFDEVSENVSESLEKLEISEPNIDHGVGEYERLESAEQGEEREQQLQVEIDGNLVDIGNLVDYEGAQNEPDFEGADQGDEYVVVEEIYEELEDDEVDTHLVEVPEPEEDLKYEDVIEESISAEDIKKNSESNLGSETSEKANLAVSGIMPQLTGVFLRFKAYCQDFPRQTTSQSTRFPIFTRFPSIST